MMNVKQIGLKRRWPRWMAMAVVGLGLAACENEEYAALKRRKQD